MIFYIDIFCSSISGSTYDGSYARPRVGNKPIDPFSRVVCSAGRALQTALGII